MRQKYPFKVRQVLAQFRVDGRLTEASPYGSGHINDTFLVYLEGPAVKKYILQRVNHHVFKDVPLLMKNIHHVCAHILSKLSQSGTIDFAPECYTFIPTFDDRNYHRDQEGNFWRLTPFLEYSHSFDLIDSEAKAFNGGMAYGSFQLLLADLSPDKLGESIPDFHNINFRLDNLTRVVEKDPVRRKNKVSQEIAFLLERQDEMWIILNEGMKGRIPLRITHNDTKFNNILFDEEDRVRGVIDLDTVMPGYVHYDFGDAIRTGASTAPEDDPDPGNMAMDLALYKAFTKGYLEKTSVFLTPAEVTHLALSAKLMTYIMAVRFLTDYIEGDVYYKTTYELQNLHRTRTQIALIKSMEAQYKEMTAFIDVCYHPVSGKK